LAQGLARRQLQREPLRAFTEFDGLHLGDFSARAQVVVLSPLRLPIPPLGHRRAPALQRVRREYRASRRRTVR
jgi:hypothetical protein